MFASRVGCSWCAVQCVCDLERAETFSNQARILMHGISETLLLHHRCIPFAFRIDLQPLFLSTKTFPENNRVEREQRGDVSAWSTRLPCKVGGAIATCYPPLGEGLILVSPSSSAASMTGAMSGTAAGGAVASGGGGGGSGVTSLATASGGGGAGGGGTSRRGSQRLSLGGGAGSFPLAPSELLMCQVTI